MLKEQKSPIKWSQKESEKNINFFFVKTDGANLPKCLIKKESETVEKPTLRVKKKYPSQLNAQNYIINMISKI